MKWGTVFHSESEHDEDDSDEEERRARERLRQSEVRLNECVYGKLFLLHFFVFLFVHFFLLLGSFRIFFVTLLYDFFSCLFTVFVLAIIIS